MDARLKAEVRQRAGARCEYCWFPEAFAELRFQVDHIIPQQHGGPTTSANLAWSCLRCNKHKGPNLSGIDSVTGHMVRLFHPRRDRWAEHFAGPDDYDIEQAQEDGYQSSMEIDDYAVTAFGANSVTYDESTDRDDSEDYVAPAVVAYNFDFNNIKEVNAFAACIRRRGAKDIRVTKHGPLPPVSMEDHSWLPHSKTFSVAFKAEPLLALSQLF